MRTPYAILALSLIVLSQVAYSQDPAPPQFGQRVRVTAPLMRVYERQGRWLEPEIDTIRVRVDSDGTVLAVPRTSLTRLDVWTGRRSNILPAAILGLFLGAGAAAATVSSTASECRYVDCYGLGVAVIGLPTAGLVLGGIIGALVKTDRWKEVPLDEAASLTVAPLRNGRVGLGVSVSF